jgi:hypothetical protein
VFSVRYESEFYIKKFKCFYVKFLTDFSLDAVHLGKFKTTLKKNVASKNMYLCLKCHWRSRVTILARDEMFLSSGGRGRIHVTVQHVLLHYERVSRRASNGGSL